VSTVARPKILCIDDEPEITSALSRLLETDFEVLIANDVPQGKAMIEKNPDLAIVLSDMRLPGGSGVELLSFVQTKVPDALRALLTAHIDFDDLVDVLNKQLVHRLILKPWENSYLRLQMIEALNSHDTFRAKRELERLAITDPVTLLRNHRYFQDQLKIEVDRAVRHGRSLSLIMIDIDHFKMFNDTYGHPAGDKLLREVATRLTETIRNLDMVARYGGEEFAMLLPDTALDRATLVGERVRLMFAENPFLIGEHSTLVTISLGIASCPEHAQTAASLVDVADRALYRAKGQGRNQSVVG
jgi:diguanylate cyclase (GGDEF)-like protein